MSRSDRAGGVADAESDVPSGNGSAAAGHASALKKRAEHLSDRTLETFAVRVWRHFLRNNGFLLSAGMSYQGLFALFGILYLAFAAIGLWLGGSDQAVRALTDAVNAYLPGIIGRNGLASPDDVATVAESATGVLSVTGAIAAIVVIWTATTAVTFTRRAVRDIFGLPFDARSFLMLKFWDLLAAAAFGLALLLGAALSVAGVWAMAQVLEMLGWDPSRPVYEVGVRVSSVLIAFAVDSAALAVMVRFLTGTSLRWRRIWPGAFLGGGAIVVLQLGAGFLLAHAPTNPLLATFAVVVAMLLWCRWVSVVALIAASWIAVGAADHDQPLQASAASITHEAEVQALVLAARVRVQRAQEECRDSTWWQAPVAPHRLRRARDEWEQAVAEASAEGLPVVEPPDDDVRGSH